MAKQSGIFKIEGTIDGITFYKSKDGHLVKKASGINRARLLTDDKFVRTRENMNEFGLLARNNRILRSALAYQLKNVSDPTVFARITSKLNEVKAFDTTSERGARDAAVALSTPEGKTAMAGFDFNSKAMLKTILVSPYTLDSATATIEIADFAPASDLAIPQGATHVNIVSVVSKIDFASEACTTLASKNNLMPVNAASANLAIKPDAMPVGEGITFYALLIEFYQEVNGSTYSLKNGSYNVLNIVAVQ